MCVCLCAASNGESVYYEICANIIMKESFHEKYSQSYHFVGEPKSQKQVYYTLFLIINKLRNVHFVSKIHKMSYFLIQLYVQKLFGRYSRRIARAISIWLNHGTHHRPTHTDTHTRTHCISTFLHFSYYTPSHPVLHTNIPFNRIAECALLESRKYAIFQSPRIRSTRVAPFFAHAKPNFVFKVFLYVCVCVMLATTVWCMHGTRSMLCSSGCTMWCAKNQFLSLN